jgi:leader peptidase (prepilin peptidase) / N-methyltransferase
MAPTAVLIPTLHLMIFMLGAVVGSFLNVVIYRVPRNLSVNEPRRSFCPNCKNGIPWYRNIPLFSWLMLRGKCADCGVSISARYVWVELLVALLFYVTYQFFGGPFQEWMLWGPRVLAVWVFLSLLVAGTFIDLEHFILPHGITLGGTAAGLVLAFWVPQMVEQETHTQGLLISFLSAFLGIGTLWTVVELGKLAFGRLKLSFEKAVPWSICEPVENEPPVLTLEEEQIPWEDLFARESDKLVITCPELSADERSWQQVMAVVNMETLTVKKDEKDQGEVISLEGIKRLSGTTTKVTIPREAMGFGDVFFIGMIGAFCGWRAVLFTIFAASIIGAVFAMVPRLFGKAEWTAKIPFGPYLAAGAALWVFYGTDFLHWYFGLIRIRSGEVLDY